MIKKFSSSQPSKPKRFYRKTKINTARHKFLNSFFNNEQLTDILKWHNDRPVGEQRRFLHVCDAFYSAHQQEKNGNKSQEEIAALPVSEKMTPFQRQTDDKDHYKKPAQLAPIDIFLSQRRYLKKKRNDEDENTLETWMESCAGSLMEASSVGSTLTDVSIPFSTSSFSSATSHSSRLSHLTSVSRNVKNKNKKISRNSCSMSMSDSTNIVSESIRSFNSSDSSARSSSVHRNSSLRFDRGAGFSSRNFDFNFENVKTKLANLKSDYMSNRNLHLHTKASYAKSLASTRSCDSLITSVRALTILLSA